MSLSPASSTPEAHVNVLPLGEEDGPGTAPGKSP